MADRRRESTGLRSNLAGGPRSTEALTITRVSKRFRGVHALDDVSLSIGRGEVVGLIGPNGCGKTTLINVITGVYRPDTGEAFCGGYRIVGRSRHAISHSGVGRTFQNIRLFGHLTVRQNVEVGWVSRRQRGDFRSEVAVNDLLQRFALEDVSERQALSLPYGTQRRVEIARALAAAPRFLLLDEPAAGMNEGESDELLETILGVRRDFRCGILIVDHDLRLIMRLCDRIHVLAEGRTLAEGTPDQIRDNKEVVEVFLGDAYEEQ